MGRGTKRARDADRDLAVEFIQDAWVDGQLTREEHDERVDLVLRARTVADVEELVTDLQGPGGAVWRPTTRPVVAPAERTPVMQRIATPVRSEDVDSSQLIVRVASVGAVALVGVVGLSALSSSGGEDWAEPAYEVYAPALQLDKLADEVETKLGSTEVHSVRIGVARARVLAPDDDSPGGATTVVYDAGSDTWSRRKDAVASGGLVDLARLRAVDLEQVVGPDETLRHAWVEKGAVDGRETCLRVVVLDEDDGDETTHHFDCDGQRVD